MSFPLYNLCDPLGKYSLALSGFPQNLVHSSIKAWILTLNHDSLFTSFSTMLKCVFLVGKAQSLTSWYVWRKTQNRHQKLPDKSRWLCGQRFRTHTIDVDTQDPRYLILSRGRSGTLEHCRVFCQVIFQGFLNATVSWQVLTALIY